MPRKNFFSPTTPKPPVPVEITAKTGARSPHVLDLRKAADDHGAKNRKEGSSFEEKVAAADARLKEMPDFIKTQANDF